MLKAHFKTASALAMLALGLAAAAPVQAQEEEEGRRAHRRGGNVVQAESAPAEARQAPAWGRSRGGGGEQAAVSPRQAPQPSPQARNWSGGAPSSESPAQRWERREARAADAPVAARAPDRSYGANARGRDGSRDGGRDRAQGQRPTGGTWAAPGDRRGGVPGGTGASSGSNTGWQRDRSYGANARRSDDWQRDRREDGWRAERRDDARTYSNGYRDGRRDDSRSSNRYGSDYRRWDNRGWRNDNRYDWYRYRAANRSLFSLGRYYAPYRDYSYSRISIGFRLGSSFYSNRYWINDPWRYRLPDVYGPYRWVRYYDDALLVDVYSGEVVDVIHNFFW